MHSPIPYTPMDDRLDTRWRHLEQHTQNAVLHRLGDRDLAASYALMLNDLRQDKPFYAQNCFLLGMRRAPGSKNRHHNEEGGLVLHLLQMYAAWEHMREHIKNTTNGHPLLTDSNVWLAILHHDLNKVWRYQLTDYATWTVDYFDNSRSKLLGGDQTSLSILMQYGITLTPLLHNALICAEGGYSALRPRAETVLSKVVYLLDEMSANVIDRLRTDRFWDSLSGGLSEDPQV